MNIDVEMDAVVIEGQRVVRPSHIARSVWMDYWEMVQREEETEE